MMDSKTEVGQENVYFEVESKQEDDARTYDDIIPRNDPHKGKPNMEARPCKDSTTEKHYRLFFIASAIAVASLLTALATLVLAVVMITSRSDVSTDTSELEKKVQELERSLSALQKNSEKMNNESFNQEDRLSKLHNRTVTFEKLSGYNATKLQEKVFSQENSFKNLTMYLESTQAQLAAMLENLKSSITMNVVELKKVWTAVNTSKQEKDNLTKKVENVSKMPGPIGPPGFNGSQGPVGSQGAVGPAGPKGSGDFSQCQFKTKAESMTPGTNRILAFLDEPANQKVIAVTCSTDYNSEYNLLSTVQGGVRRYVWSCNGKSTFFTRGTSCYLNYWICPLTT